MPKPITYSLISQLREEYQRELDDRPVAISPSLEIITTALDHYDPITVSFAGSGAWHNFYAVEIRGGPDDNKVVDTRPWHPAEYLEYGATVYNGTREEYDRNLGYAARPLIERATGGILHAVTVSYLSAMLHGMRERNMNEYLLSLYGRLEKETM